MSRLDNAILRKSANVDLHPDINDIVKDKDGEIMVDEPVLLSEEILDFLNAF